MAKIKVPDTLHTERTDMWARHMPQYADMCPVCKPLIERNKRIAALYKSLKEFGYSSLTHEEVATAYDSALAGEPPSDGDIISMLVHRQMAEAGLIKKED